MTKPRTHQRPSQGRSRSPVRRRSRPHDVDKVTSRDLGEVMHDDGSRLILAPCLGRLKHERLQHSVQCTRCLLYKQEIHQYPSTHHENKQHTPDIKTSGFLSLARAIARRWHCLPPHSFHCSPRSASYPSESSHTQSWRDATRHAS